MSTERNIKTVSDISDELVIGIADGSVNQHKGKITLTDLAKSLNLNSKEVFNYVENKLEYIDTDDKEITNLIVTKSTGVYFNETIGRLDTKYDFQNLLVIYENNTVFVNTKSTLFEDFRIDLATSAGLGTYNSTLDDKIKVKQGYRASLVAAGLTWPQAFNLN